MTIEHIWLDIMFLLASSFTGWNAYRIRFYNNRTGITLSGLTATVRILLAGLSILLLLMVGVVEGLVVIR